MRSPTQFFEPLAVRDLLRDAWEGAAAALDRPVLRSRRRPRSIRATRRPRTRCMPSVFRGWSGWRTADSAVMISPPRPSTNSSPADATCILFCVRVGASGPLNRIRPVPPDGPVEPLAWCSPTRRP